MRCLVCLPREVCEKHLDQSFFLNLESVSFQRFRKGRIPLRRPDRAREGHKVRERVDGVEVVRGPEPPRRPRDVSSESSRDHQTARVEVAVIGERRPCIDETAD